MSYYQEGYNKGYDDALNGEPEPESGLIYTLISAVLDDEEQVEWEEGYKDGYAAGKKQAEDDQ